MHQSNYKQVDSKMVKLSETTVRLYTSQLDSILRCGMLTKNDIINNHNKVIDYIRKSDYKSIAPYNAIIWFCKENGHGNDVSDYRKERNILQGSYNKKVRDTKYQDLKTKYDELQAKYIKLLEATASK